MEQNLTKSIFIKLKTLWDIDMLHSWGHCKVGFCKKLGGWHPFRNYAFVLIFWVHFLCIFFIAHFHILSIFDYLNSWTRYFPYTSRDFTTLNGWRIDSLKGVLQINKGISLLTLKTHAVTKTEKVTKLSEKPTLMLS